MQHDVYNTKKLFEYYVNKNPNGKIIFISSAGDLHLGHQRTVLEGNEPHHILYMGNVKLM